ncbi:hypothetical protein NQ318_002887 [Aromia moschata]|uniref:EamA domain-containing protein n=1 Tax=Aromia moschata TaxID=1265417 RepID=A0AAV8Y8R1_9CUCU|nr:hypothetical protein NQ318_002887 [Aromia moschata]
MVVTGSVTTLSGKWANRIESVGNGGENKRFTHPFFQTCCLFFGELCCLFTFKLLYRFYNYKSKGSEDVRELTRGNRNFNPLYLLVPALCDIMGSSLMYIGLNITYATIVPRLRAAVIIFVCLFSICFLKTFPNSRELCGILLIASGLTLGGLPDFLSRETSRDGQSRNIITGYVLVLGAQIMTSIHMVYEEKFVTRQDLPSLQAVGWEGLFGFSSMVLLLLPFYFIRAGPPVTQRPGDRLEDTIEALKQIGNSWKLMLTIFGSTVAVAFFNFAGISLTKELSATARMVVDSMRSIIVWIGSVVFFEQKFHWLQPVAFVLIIVGMCLYNGIATALVRKRLGCGGASEEILEVRRRSGSLHQT